MGVLGIFLKNSGRTDHSSLIIVSQWLVICGAQVSIQRGPIPFKEIDFPSSQTGLLRKVECLVPLYKNEAGLVDTLP
jgi:hypothetical protein